MKALVTGGGGFLGGAIVRRLVERGDRVRSFARGDYPELARQGVQVIRGDLADAEAVAGAVAGCDVVFHVAARAGIWGRYRDFHRANVTGTAHVIAACRRHGVGRLVYTSSPSVVFDGRDMEGVDESAPYPRDYEAHYPRTKALAERLVLGANGPNLATVALRPHLVWGPGDPHLVPRILARAKAGRLQRIGPGDQRVDTTYIDNAADAHLLAGDRLAPGAAVAGRAYFIAQGEPLPLWELIDRILALANLPPVRRTMHPKLAYLVGWLSEAVHGVLGWEEEPAMTRFLARELATSHWFNLDAARRDLGYQPAVSLEDGLRRLGKSLAGGLPGTPP